MMPYRLLPIVFILLLTLISCKEDSVEPEAPIIGNFGKIILPEGSNVDIEEYKLISPLGENDIKANGSFNSTGAKNNEQLLFVNNGRGETLLIAYPLEDEELVIDSESSALALMLMTINTSTFSLEERKEVVRYFKSHPGFPGLVTEVTESIKAEKDLLSGENTTLLAAISAFYKVSDTGGRVASVKNTFPVTFTREGYKLSFQNKASSHIYVAGVYKDGKFMKALPIEGAKFSTRPVPSFLGDLMAGNIDLWEKKADGSKIEHLLEGEGNYKVVITSGHGLMERCCSEEGRMSNRLNGNTVASEIMDAVGKGVLDLIPDECAKSVSNLLYEAIKGLTDEADSKDEFMTALYKTMYNVLANFIGATEECIKPGNYIKSAAKALNMFEKIKASLQFGKTSHDWFSYPIKHEVEFSIGPHTVSMVDGNNQVGESQKQLSKPLQVVVKDASGNIVEGIEVEWKLKTGGGTLSAAKTKTNTEGIAQVEWTLGTAASQEVEAIVKKSDGTLVIGAPVLFKASITSILGKWKLVKSYFQDGTTPGSWTTGYPDDHFTFNSDGTLLIVEEGDDDHMKYTFDKAKMELTTIEESVQETVVRVFKIKTLTATDFVIEHRSNSFIMEYVLKR